MERKKAAFRPPGEAPRCLLAGGNSLYRAGFNASAAIGTKIGIDHKLIVALTDRLHRAGGFTCTAGNAFA